MENLGAVNAGCFWNLRCTPLRPYPLVFSEVCQYKYALKLESPKKKGNHDQWQCRNCVWNQRKARLLPAYRAPGIHHDYPLFHPIIHTNYFSRYAWANRRQSIRDAGPQKEPGIEVFFLCRCTMNFLLGNSVGFSLSGTNTSRGARPRIDLFWTFTRTILRLARTHS
jgi:hypothetical protein